MIARADPGVVRSGKGRGARPKRSGGVSGLGPSRWLVGVEGEAHPITGKRRRGHTRVVVGQREQAEVELARLKLTSADGLLPSGTRARIVRAACEVYLGEARTELQTLRTDRSACTRTCGTVLPGGAVFGDVPLSKVAWKVIEQVYAAWEDQLQPPTRARYAST